LEDITMLQLDKLQDCKIIFELISIF